MAKKTKIIAVSGGSGSGKTTIVNRLKNLCAQSSLMVLQMDHYYCDLAHLTQSERDLRNFDQPQSFDVELLHDQLLCLSRGEAVERPTYDFATHTRTGTTFRLQPSPVILFDGFLALADERIRRLFDLSVYVDVSDDVRFIRRLKRDIAERGRTMDSVITQYLATVKPMHDQYVAPQKLVADVVINWESYNERAIMMLSHMIKTIPNQIGAE